MKMHSGENLKGVEGKSRKEEVIISKRRRYSGEKTGRTQSGHIHVCLIGCSKFIVFYKDLDYIMFLRILDEHCAKDGTIITEIVLMTNHVHIQMLTRNVTKFMRSFLNAYVKWYNRNHEMEGKLFKSPFLSSAKFTKDMVIRSQLYILKNPLKAGLCKGQTANYLWSSYGAHFGGKCNVSNFINVDTTLLDSYFKSKWFLDKAINDADFSSVDIFEKITTKTALEISKESQSKESQSKESQSKESQSKESQSKDFQPKKQFGCNINNYELCKFAMEMMCGRSISQLSLNEIKELAVRLKEETGANYNQIASLIHTSRDYVMKVVREYRYMKERKGT